MDETPDLTLPPPVVVGRPSARPTSSLTWTLVPTLLVLVALSLLGVYVLVLHAVGYAAATALAPIGGGSAADVTGAPHLSDYLLVLVLTVAAGLVVAVVSATTWDRASSRPGARGPAAWPTPTRGLTSAAIASAVAAGVLLAGLGLSPADLLVLLG